MEQIVGQLKNNTCTLRRASEGPNKGSWETSHHFPDRFLDDLINHPHTGTVVSFSISTPPPTRMQTLKFMAGFLNSGSDRYIQNMMFTYSYMYVELYIHTKHTSSLLKYSTLYLLDSALKWYNRLWKNLQLLKISLDAESRYWLHLLQSININDSVISNFPTKVP